MKRCLLEYSKGLLQRTFYALEGEITIGRDTENAICLAEEKVSRTHARLSLKGRGWVLEDLKSRNGTFVNGQKIELQELKHNDLIRIGQSSLRFLVVEEPERRKTLVETGEAPITDLPQDIQEQMNLVKTFLEALPIGVAIINAKKEVLYSNRALSAHRNSEPQAEGAQLGVLLECALLDRKEMSCGFLKECALCAVQIAVDKAFVEEIPTVDMEIPWGGKEGTPSAYIRFSIIPLPYSLTGESLAHLTWEDITLRKRTQEVLHKAHEELERRVEERTAELKAANENLQQEISERRLAEVALRESEEKYRELVQSANSMILRFDSQGKVTFINEFARGFFGYTEEEILGKNVLGTIVPEVDSSGGDLSAMLRRILEHPDRYANNENENICRDGKRVWVSWTNRAIRDQDGNMAGILAIGNDITDRKRLELQLRQAQKMEAIGTLAGGIAHDFNNLLMGILGHVSLMLWDMEEGDAQYERLKGVESLVQSASRLTSQLLGYARKGKYELRVLDLNELVASTSETFGRTRKDVVIHRELFGGLRGVEVDRGQMEQVLFNLYVNAADAMVGGGQLRLKTGDVTDVQMRGRGYEVAAGEYVVLSVSDTGIGMDGGTMERIFDPFFTTKEVGTGTGLGLASVYGIVKGHGGYIDVESEVGEGTTFRLYLPATDKAVEGAMRSSEAPRGGSETILLVDDEDFVLEVGARLLEALGYEVFQARSGGEAVEIYGAHKGVIDLVVLDMVMPGMGGGETYDRLKEIDPQVKVILSSGYSIDGQAKQILQRGCQGFIQKPFGIKELSGKIREVLSTP
jgi:two-component system cell cycle sensor histidine kinase/response regulator CckA